MRHNHAKDYLLEFTSNTGIKHWLQAIIHEAILTNGNISDENYDKIYLD